MPDLANLEYTIGAVNRRSAIRGFLEQFAKVARALVLDALRISDRTKWKKYKFPEEWALRSQRIAEIVPHDSHVFEFGAGPCGLRQYLHPSCSLTSSDIVKHSPDIKIIDLNRRPLPLLGEPESQVGVFAGVLEYVSDVHSLLPWIANHFETCIASYECAQPKPGILGGIRESLGRACMGWVNHFTEQQFKALFAAVGFQLAKQVTWGDHDPGEIFSFERRRGANMRTTHHSLEEFKLKAETAYDLQASANASQRSPSS